MVSRVTGLGLECYCLGLVTSQDIIQDSYSEDDLHQCGRCKMTFNRIKEYINHKRTKQCHRSSDHQQAHPSVPIAGSSPGRACNEDCNPAVNFSMTEFLTSSGSEVPGLYGSLTTRKICSPDCSLSSSEAVKLDSVGHPVIENCHVDLAEVRELMNDTLPPVVVTESEYRGTSPLETFDNASSAPASEGYTTQVEIAEVVSDIRPPPAYKCPQCNFTAPYRDDFDQHLRREHGLSSHVCSICNRPLADASKLKRHMRICTGTNVRSLKATSSVSKWFARCSRKTFSKGPGDRSNFSCKFCSASFDQYAAIVSHVTAAHSDQRPGICRFCGMWFNSHYRLRRHVTSSVHDDIADEEMRSFKRDLERTTVRYTPEAARLLLQARRRTRRPSVPHACEPCGRSFSSSSTLRRHQRNTHARPSAAQTSPADVPMIAACQQCGMTFDRRRAYLRHRRDAHRKVVVADAASSKLCRVCGRGFKHGRFHAKRHVRVMHTARQQLPIGALSTLSSGCCERDSGSSVSVSLCFICFRPSSNDHQRRLHIELFHRVWLPRSSVNPEVRDAGHGVNDILQSCQGTERLNETTGRALPILRGSLSATADTVGSWASSLQDVGRDHRPECSSSCLDEVTGDASKNEDKLSCPYCERCFSCVDGLYRHKLDDHGLQPMFQCIVASCRKMFLHAIDYEHHAEVAGHSQAAFICSVCNDHYADASALIAHRASRHRHVRAVNTDKDSGCSTKTRVSGDVVHTAVSTKKKRKSKKSYKCPSCAEEFIARLPLVRHQVVAHAVGLGCVECGRVFAKREHLQRHVASRHSSSKTHVCQNLNCGRAFARIDKLREHERCHDNGDRRPSLPCSKCGRLFRSRVCLRRHERSHAKAGTSAGTGARYRCTRCPSAFSHSSKLVQHLASQHGRGAGKDIYAHRCGTCGKVFPRPERLQRHVERAHNIAASWLRVCSFCGKGFAGVRSYDAHVARHHSNGASDDGIVSAAPVGRVKKSRVSSQSLDDEQSASIPDVSVPSYDRSPNQCSTACRVSTSVSTSTSLNFATLGRIVDGDGVRTSSVGRSLALSKDSVARQNDTYGCSSPSNICANIYGSSSRFSEQCCNNFNCLVNRGEQPSDVVDSTRSARYASPPRSLPYLHHPSAGFGMSAYSGYSASYRGQSTSHRASQFGFYHPPQFGYSCHPTSTARTNIFASDAANSSMLHFGAGSRPSMETGHHGRWSSGGVARTAMTPDLGKGSCHLTTPARPLVTQSSIESSRETSPTEGTLLDRQFGRWFDSVPSLLPSAASIDHMGLDSTASRWSRPVITPSLDPSSYRSRFGIAHAAITTTSTSSESTSIGGISTGLGDQPSLGSTVGISASSSVPSRSAIDAYPPFASYQSPAIHNNRYSMGPLALASKCYENGVASSSSSEHNIFSSGTVGSLHYHNRQNHTASSLASSSMSHHSGVRVPLSLLPPPPPPPSAATGQHHSHFRQQFANYQHWPPPMPPVYNWL